jgi:hypothetical protein
VVKEKQMTEAQQKIVRKFLNYSFSPVQGKYEDLTEEEQSFCSPSEFAELVSWVNE